MHLMNKIIILVGAFSGLAAANIKPISAFPITWNDPIGMLLVAPLTVLMIFGFNLLMSPRGTQWTSPTLKANPLVVSSNPLNMILVIGFAFTASGIVAVMFSLFSIKSSFIISAYFLSGGVGTLLGVLLTTAIFRSRFKRN